jgi:hypothetical protein
MASSSAALYAKCYSLIRNACFASLPPGAADADLAGIHASSQVSHFWSCLESILDPRSSGVSGLAGRAIADLAVSDLLLDTSRTVANDICLVRVFAIAASRGWVEPNSDAIVSLCEMACEDSDMLLASLVLSVPGLPVAQVDQVRYLLSDQAGYDISRIPAPEARAHAALFLLEPPDPGRIGETAVGLISRSESVADGVDYTDLFLATVARHGSGTTPRDRALMLGSLDAICTASVNGHDISLRPVCHLWLDKASLAYFPSVVSLLVAPAEGDNYQDFAASLHDAFLTWLEFIPAEKAALLSSDFLLGILCNPHEPYRNSALRALALRRPALVSPPQLAVPRQR